MAIARYRFFNAKTREDAEVIVGRAEDKSVLMKLPFRPQFSHI
jgi:hypothetical protein